MISHRNTLHSLYFDGRVQQWSEVMKSELTKFLAYGIIGYSALQKLQTCSKVVLMVRNSGPRARQLVDPMWFHFRRASYLSSVK